MTKVLGGLVASLLVIGCSAREPFEPREMFAVQPEAVLTFEYETPAFRLSAHRFSEQEAFQVVLQLRAEGELVHCMGDSRFDRVLRPFESLHTRRRITEHQLTKLTQPNVYHRLRVATAPPLETFEVVLRPLSIGSHAVERDGFSDVLDLTHDSVQALRRSCKP